MGCSENTRKACKSLAFGRVLPTSRVGYHAGNIESACCDVTLPREHYFWMTTKPRNDGEDKENGKNNMFILKNNNLAHASRYFVHFFAVVVACVAGVWK